MVLFVSILTWIFQSYDIKKNLQYRNKNRDLKSNYHPISLGNSKSADSGSGNNSLTAKLFDESPVLYVYNQWIVLIAWFLWPYIGFIIHELYEYRFQATTTL